MNLRFLLLLAVLALSGCQNSHSEPPDGSSGPEPLRVKASDPKLKWLGPREVTSVGSVQIAWPASGFECWFEGNSCYFLADDRLSRQPGADFTHQVWLEVELDDERFPLALFYDSIGYDLSPHLGDREVHHLRVRKRTESAFGTVEIVGLVIDEGKLMAPPTPERRIEAIGNSITCGYGVHGQGPDCPFTPDTEDALASYAALAADSLGADLVMFAFSGTGVYRNYEGDTVNTATNRYNRVHADRSNPHWDRKDWLPDVVLINLGTNDFAQGIPDKATFVRNYLRLIGKVRAHAPEAQIVLLVPPMISDTYPATGKWRTTLTGYLQSIIASRKQQGDARISFLALSAQGKLGYGCDWHPSEAQQAQNANELTEYLKTLMNW